MDVVIESSRTHADAQNDYLAVVARLERGEYGTLQLGQAQLRVTYIGSATSPSIIDLVGIERLSDSVGRIEWQNISRDDPHLNLHANEKSQFAAVLKIPREACCVIEVALLTHRRLDGFEWLGQTHWGQRRSSTVSLPLRDQPSQKV